MHKTQAPSSTSSPGSLDLPACLHFHVMHDANNFKLCYLPTEDEKEKEILNLDSGCIC
jgi:hypothetical protein